MDEHVNMQLDIVNVARGSCLLVRVDDVVPPGFEVAASPWQGNIVAGSLDMRGKRLGPFKVESVSLRLQAAKAGVVRFSPRVIFVDEKGMSKTVQTEQATVVVHPRLAFAFQSEAAEKVFDYLTRSFVHDYMRQRVALEQSGWRTLTQIVKSCRLSKWSVYGDARHRGPARAELERRGLIETRVFPGERGRGGRILKMRVAYDRETIKRYIDERVTKPTEK